MTNAIVIKENREFASWGTFFVYCFSGAVCFLILHFETLSVGPLKVAHIWKVAVVILLAIYIIVKDRGKLKVYIFSPLLFLAILQIFSYEVFVNPMNWLGLFMQALLFPIFGIFLVSLPPKKLQRLILFFSVFVVSSFLPYELGILESLGREYDMASFGAADVRANLGLFQTPHSASTALAMAFLVLCYFWLANIYSRFLISIFLVLGFYFLLMTYVRTGLAMSALGLLILIGHFFFRSSRKAFGAIIIAAFVAVLAMAWLSENPVLMAKILGERTHNPEESFSTLGSGRGKMLMAGLRIFSDFNLVEVVFGVGETEQKIRMDGEIGIALVPHNGLVYLLLVNGILGLALFLWFVLKVWRQCRFKDERSVLLRSCLAAYLLMTILQNYNLVYPLIIFLVVLAFVISERRYFGEVRRSGFMAFR